MRFERTGSSIRNLSQGTVSLEDMLDMMICVRRDACEANGIKKVSEMRVNNPEKALVKMTSLMEMLLQIYKANGEKFQEDEEFSAEVSRTSQQIMELNAKYSEIAAKLSQAESDLENAKRSAAQKRQELAEAENERDAAQAKVQDLDKDIEASKEQVREAQARLERVGDTEKRILEKQNCLTQLFNSLDSMKNDEFLADKLFASDSGKLTVSARADLAVAQKKLDSWAALGSWTEEMENRINGLTSVLASVLMKLVHQAEHLADSPEGK